MAKKRKKEMTPLTPEEQERQAIIARAMANLDREVEDRIIQNQLAREAREAERQQQAS
jgi:hypothetical protein